MTDEMKVTLDSLGHGAALEMFQYEFERVLDNILDPNTKATTGRSVTLTVNIKPDQDRAFGSTVIEVKSKLAPVRGVTTGIYIGRRAGQAVASERDTRQLAFDEANVTNIAAKGGSKK